MADTSHNDSVEIWKPVPGWEGLYSVSDFGNMRREARTAEFTRRDGKTVRRSLAELLLNPTIFCGRYRQVTLQADEVRRTAYVHQLVCQAFHGSPPSDSHVVAHNDGNGLNNKSGNLRWATHKENTADMSQHGTKLVGDRHPGTSVSNAAVEEIRKASDWRRDREFANLYGVKPKTIQGIRLGFKRKSAR